MRNQLCLLSCQSKRLLEGVQSALLLLNEGENVVTRQQSG